MPRVILLATTRSYRAGAFLDAAAREGIAMTVGSERPQALAGMNPAAHLVLDFRRPDDAVERIVGFAGVHPLDAVIAADDEGAVIAARAAARLGFRHASPEAVLRARHKHRMREALGAAGVPQPWFRVVRLSDDVHAIARDLDYPCVLKPVALGASRGVIRCDDAGSLVAARDRIAALLAREGVTGEENTLLAEGFVPGREVAVEGLLAGGKLHVLARFDKPDPLEGPYFEETLYVTPSRLPARTQAALDACVARCAAALGLAHGPVHAELRVHDDGVWPLELAPRSIGGLCSRALRFTGDRTLEQVLLRAALGLDATPREREPEASGVMMLPIPGPGVLADVRGAEDARRVPHVTELRLTVPKGDVLEPLPEGGRYLGFVFARAGRPEAVEAALRAAAAALTFVVHPVHAHPESPS